MVKRSLPCKNIFNIGDQGGPKGWLVMKSPGCASAWPASASASVSASACLQIVQGRS